MSLLLIRSQLIQAGWTLDSFVNRGGADRCLVLRHDQVAAFLTELVLVLDRRHAQQRARWRIFSSDELLLAVTLVVLQRKNVAVFTVVCANYIIIRANHLVGEEIARSDYP